MVEARSEIDTISAPAFRLIISFLTSVAINVALYALNDARVTSR